MRRQGAWKWKLALVAGLSSAVAWAADKDAPSRDTKAEPAKTGWVRRWFSPADKPAEKKAKDDKAADKDELPPVEEKPVSAQIDSAVKRRQQEEAALFRRLAVCDELMCIAMETKDEQLSRQATQLNQRALANYTQRIANLPASTARFESDEQTLERHLGVAGTTLPYSVTGQERTQRASREEEP